MTKFDWAVVAGLIAALVAVTGWARRALWVAIRGVTNVALALLAAAIERRRGRERANRRLSVSRVWRCTLYVESAGAMRPLITTTVPGPWRSAADVERDAMGAWVRENGWPAAGRLCARAEPVRTTTAPLNTR